MVTRRNESGLPESSGSALAGRRKVLRPSGQPHAVQQLARVHNGVVPIGANATARLIEYNQQGRWKADAVLQRSRLQKIRDPKVEDIIAHYRRLTHEDCRRRFGGTVSDDQLANIAQAASTPSHSAFGFLANGRLAALAETFEIPCLRMAEAAFSVETELQGHHLGWRLMLEVLRDASRRSLHGIMFQFVASNSAMLGLARHAGAILENHGDEIVGHVRLNT